MCTENATIDIGVPRTENTVLHGSRRVFLRTNGLGGAKKRRGAYVCGWVCVCGAAQKAAGVFRRAIRETKAALAACDTAGRTAADIERPAAGREGVEICRLTRR